MPTNRMYGNMLNEMTSSQSIAKPNPNPMPLMGAAPMQVPKPAGMNQGQGVYTQMMNQMRGR